MEAIVFCGVQASGKSTFFKERFFKTHVHISLDLLRTRHREDAFLDVCVKTQQAFVVDNTNPTATEREKYIALAKKHKYKLVAYFFESTLEDALLRNNFRQGKENIPEIGIKGTFKKLEKPLFNEGFDEIYCVNIAENGFSIKPFDNEI